MAYDRLACELYGLVHRGNPGDVRFYQRLCGGAEDVLELGVGAGRIAIPLARAGCRVTGVEREPEMLALARDQLMKEPASVRRRLTLIEGDIRALALGAHFSRILLPNNVLCCLLTRADLAACLAGVRMHLAPGGRVALDVYRVDETRVRTRSAARPGMGSLLVTLEHRGVVYDIHEESAWTSEPQRLDVVYRHVARGGSQVSYAIPQRFLRPRELEALLAAAGLRPVLRQGGFQAQPARAGNPHIVIVAEEA